MVDTRPTEEILAAYPKWRYDRTDRNGTRYFNDYTCDRCGGQGGAQTIGDASVYLRISE